MSRGSSTYLLRLPASLKAAVTEISKEDGTSIDQFITTAVAEKVAAMKTAEFYTVRGGEADVEASRRLLRRDGRPPPEAMMPWTSLVQDRQCAEPMLSLNRLEFGGTPGSLRPFTRSRWAPATRWARTCGPAAPGG